MLRCLCGDVVTTADVAVLHGPFPCIDLLGLVLVVLRSGASGNIGDELGEEWQDNET